MTLLNGMLALGALAFTVPLAIHLLFRSRFKTIEWGAMHLLDAVVRINRRRLQLLELLLLLLRCAIPILLALALARPVLTGFRALPGDAAQTVVLVVDDSRSMGAADAAGQSAMQRAALSLEQYLSQLSLRDEVMLVRSSDAASPVSSMGRDQAIRAVREITPQGSAAHLDLLLRSATTALADAAHLQRRVVLVSDLRSRDLGDAVLDGIDPVERLLEAMDPQPEVMVLNVGSPQPTLDNLYVEAIETEAKAAVVERPQTLIARIRNDGDRAGSDVAVSWWIDGQKVESQRIAVQPRASSTAGMTHTFEAPGVHAVAVTVEWPDALLADNQRQLAVEVIQAVNVLLIDGQPDDAPLAGETDFLAIALSPFGFGGASLPDSVRTRTVKVSGRTPVDTIAKQLVSMPADVVVLANVKDVGESLRTLLAEFVASGGAAVVFDGDHVQPADHNATWKTATAEFQLPAILGELRGDPEARRTSQPFKPELNPHYSPWSSLLPGDSTTLKEVDIYAYRNLQLRQNPTAGPTSDERDAGVPATEHGGSSGRPVVLMRTGAGEPLAVLASWSEGRVVQFAVGCDGDWTTLPLRAAFLPMMQQLMIDLVGGGTSANVGVGETMSVAASEFPQPTVNPTASVSPAADPSPLPSASLSAAYTVEPPSGDEIKVPLTSVPGAEQEQRIVYDANEGVGVYRFRQLAKDAAGSAQIASTLRVAEVDAAESLLRPADPARATALAARLGASLHTDAASLVQNDRVDRYGREVWRWFLGLLLLVMIAELVLQQRRVRRSTPPMAHAKAVLE